MLCSMLGKVDTDKCEASCLVVGAADPALYDVFKVMPFNLVPVSFGHDVWGLDHLLRTVIMKEFDMFVTVGIDIWRFGPIMENLRKALTKQNVPWVGILPYDIDRENKETFDLMKAVDIPCIYSEFGFSVVDGNVKNARYYRPDLFGKGMYQPIPKEMSTEFYNAHFSSLPNDSFIFGFVGNNQVRKEPHKVLKAFLKVQKILEGKRNVGLYMHTEVNGIYNLQHLGQGWGVDKPETIILKRQDNKYSIHDMVHAYNAMDCLVLPSLTEGLSWTPLEAMLCKTMVLVTDTTAHKELVKDERCLVPCTETVMLPTQAINANSHIEAKGCTVDDLVEHMLYIVNMGEEEKNTIIEENHGHAKKWLEGIDNIADVISDTFEMLDKAGSLSQDEKRNGKVLIMQHSSGGDVLMMTRCFKGIKERHPDMELDFMTMPQYIDMVIDNPYIDNIIPWDEQLQADYTYSYNPHGERILPGHWGRNSNSILADFYWKVLKVEPDKFGLQMDTLPEWVEETLVTKVLPICIVHTTGGDAEFRTYKYMPEVCDMLDGRFYTIQMGGPDDYPAAADLDLRGQLSYRQEAYLMSKATLAITVDSFQSHLAGAMGISQIALYGSGNAAVCQPKQVEGTLKALSPDYIRHCKGLGPCSASVRDCPIPCTGLHDPKAIISAIDEIESNGGL